MEAGMDKEWVDGDGEEEDGDFEEADDWEEEEGDDVDYTRMIDTQDLPWCVPPLGTARPSAARRVSGVKSCLMGVHCHDHVRAHRSHVRSPLLAALRTLSTCCTA
jgi:hypothetical protein